MNPNIKTIKTNTSAIAIVSLYNYANLAETAKTHARKQWLARYDTIDLDFALDDAKTISKHLGFDIKQIRYSGFYQQGDGASINGDWNAERVDPVGPKDFINDDNLVAIYKTLCAIAKRNSDAVVKLSPHGRSCHEYSVSYSHNDISEDDETLFEETARNLMRWVYAQLKDEYEHQTSDDVVAETLIANEYLFTEDGKMFK
jgi:hypothetical protein